MLKKIKLMLCPFLLTNLIAEETPPASPSFFATESFKRAHIGIYFVDLKTKADVIDYSKEQYFIPASLQKMITASSALTSLGSNYTFTTKLEYEGVINQKGVLEGNLWLTGNGDPTLPIDIFTTWENTLKDSGILQVAGKVYADVSHFETALASPHWEFSDIGNYYGVGASPLTVNRSMYYLTFQPGNKVGDPATVVNIHPNIPFLHFENEVTTGPSGSGDNVYVFGSEYSSKQFYRGTVPIDEATFTVKAAIPDPALYCAMEFATRIDALKGFEVFREKNKNRPKAIELITTYSKSLQELIKEMNFFSINLYAEHILKAIGKGVSEEGLTWEREFLKWQGIPAKVYDGAGIARKNLITPKGLLTLLINERNSSHWESFYCSLPEYGKEGTLENQIPLVKANLRAKDGSMSGIYNLAGYITFPETGKEYAFAIFCNSYEGPLQEVKEEVNRFLLSLEPILQYNGDQKE